MHKLAIATSLILICGLGDKCSPKPEIGLKLEVVSAPEGATVSIDGVEKGETPLTLTDLGVEEGQKQKSVVLPTPPLPEMASLRLISSTP